MWCLGVATLFAIALTGCAQDNQSTLNDMLSAKVAELSQAFSEQVHSLGAKGAADAIGSVPATLQAAIWDKDDQIFGPGSSVAIYSIKTSGPTVSLNVVVSQRLDVQVGWTPKVLRSYMCLKFAGTRASKVKVADTRCPPDLKSRGNFQIDRVPYKDLNRR